MEAQSLTEDLLLGFLHRMMSRHAATQLFLFGPAGAPFWAARTPLERWELDVLREALDLLEALESDHPRPFIGHDPRGRFAVAALDFREDLYVVLFSEGLAPLGAETRVADLRAQLAPLLVPIRERWLSPAP